MGRLLAAASEAIEKLKMGLLRGGFDEQARGERRRQAGVAIEGAVAASLKLWREVITSPPDVASGRYQQAPNSPRTCGRYIRAKERTTRTWREIDSGASLCSLLPASVLSHK